MFNRSRWMRLRQPWRTWLDREPVEVALNARRTDSQQGGGVVSLLRSHGGAFIGADDLDVASRPAVNRVTCAASWPRRRTDRMV